MPSHTAFHSDLADIKCTAEELLVRISSLSAALVSQPLCAAESRLPVSQQLSSNISEIVREVGQDLSLARYRLRELQNTIIPVNSLPSEILAYIFDLLHSLPDSALPVPAETHAIFDCLCKPSSRLHVSQTSHVCRHWRRTALGTGSLWDTFSLRLDDLRRSDSFPSICLDRSSNSPLHVTIRPSEDDEDVEDLVWDRLLSQIPRLRTLSTMHMPGTHAGILTHLTKAAPMLQVLQVKFDNYFGAFGGQTIREGENVELPTLFAGHTPKLQHLEVQFFRRFPGNNFQSLRSLRLHSQKYATPADINCLFGLLNDNPTLTELFFAWCTLLLDSQLMQPVSGSSHIPLPRPRLRNLSRLDFQDCSLEFMCSLLRQVDLPLQRLIISVRDPTFELEDGLLQTITAHLGPVQKLRLVYGRLNCIEASGSSNIARIDSRPLNPHFGLDAQLQSSSGITQSLRMVFDLSSIVELKLAGEDSSHRMGWVSAFREMAALTRLVLHPPTTAVSTCQWLVALVALHNQDDYPTPKLTEICVYPPRDFAWHTITELCERRAILGRSLRCLRVMLPTDATRIGDYFSAGSDEAWLIAQKQLRESGTVVWLDKGDGYFSTDMPGLAAGTYMVEASAV